jgi:hypothetical protein
VCELLGDTWLIISKEDAWTLLDETKPITGDDVNTFNTVLDVLGVLTPMQNRKTVDGFAFSVLPNEDGAGPLELTKA